MPNIKLILDRSNREYKPGDVINVEVRLHIKSELKFRSIYVKIKGYAYTSFCTTGNVQNTAKERLFEIYQTMAGTRSGPKIRLPAGSYIYKTWFNLPQNLPENCEFGSGYIRYEAEVRMELPWKFDVKDRTNFHIVPHHDLNEFPHLREPVWAEKIQRFGFIRQLLPMRMCISLPRCGFVPGDRVQCKLTIENDSAVAVHTADVKLLQTIKFGLGVDALVTCRTLGSHKFTGLNGALVPAMQSKECAVDLYFNPLWDYRYLTGCQIITVEYYVMCKARTSIWHADLSNRTRIHVGTVPLSPDQI